MKVERVKGTGPRNKSSDKEQEVEQTSRSQWLVYTEGQDDPDGPFDAIIATVGTCGDPMRIGFEGIEEFEKSGGRVVHSSELDQLSKGSEESQGDQGGGKGKEREEDDGKSVSTDSREGPAPDEDDDESITTSRQPEAGVSYADKAKSGTSLDVSSGSDQEVANSDKPKPLDVKGKTIAIIGSSASGVEAAEWAASKGAGKVYILAR